MFEQQLCSLNMLPVGHDKSQVKWFCMDYLINWSSALKTIVCGTIVNDSHCNQNVKGKSHQKNVIHIGVISVSWNIWVTVAMEEGPTSYVRTLNLDKLASDKDYLWTSLENICKSGNATDFCEILTSMHKEKNIDINSLFNIVNTQRNGETLMQICARNGNLQLIKFFVRNGASVNRDNSYGWTVLHEASLHNQVEVIFSYKIPYNSLINSQSWFSSLS